MRRTRRGEGMIRGGHDAVRWTLWGEDTMGGDDREHGEETTTSITRSIRKGAYSPGVELGL